MNSAQQETVAEVRRTDLGTVAVGTSTTGPGRRIPFRDRAWMPFHTVRAVAPVRTPSRAQLIDLLIMLREIDPTHPLVCRIDSDRMRLRSVPTDRFGAFIDEVIIELPDGMAAPTSADSFSAASLTRMMQQMPLQDLPFRIAVADRAAAFRSAHVIGDTATANPWFFGLLRAADPDRALDLLTGSSGTPAPLASAVARQFLRNPGQAVRAIRGSLPLGPKALPGKGSGTDAELGLPELVTVSAGPTTDADLRAWRKEHASNVSMAAAWMAASVRALRAHDLDPGRGVFTMMNCRRYLPEGTAVQGNFATGPYLLPDDLADPKSLGAELTAATDTGVPLVLLAAMATRSLIRRGRTRPGTKIIPGAPTKINLSHFGRITADDVDWLDEPAQQGGAEYVVGPEPSGPDAITYVFAQTPYGMQLSATAYPVCTDIDALRRAMHSVAEDPVALLNDAST